MAYIKLKDLTFVIILIPLIAIQGGALKSVDIPHIFKGIMHRNLLQPASSKQIPIILINMSLKFSLVNPLNFQNHINNSYEHQPIS